MQQLGAPKDIEKMVEATAKAMALAAHRCGTPRMVKLYLDDARKVLLGVAKSAKRELVLIGYSIGLPRQHLQGVAIEDFGHDPSLGAINVEPPISGHRVAKAFPESNFPTVPLDVVVHTGAISIDALRQVSVELSLSPHELKSNLVYGLHDSGGCLPADLSLIDSINELHASDDVSELTKAT